MMVIFRNMIKGNVYYVRFVFELDYIIAVKGLGS
jgi:hypothetical protein